MGSGLLSFETFGFFRVSSDKAFCVNLFMGLNLELNLRACRFEPFIKKAKIHIVILSVSEKSKEFKTHFKFKAKNLRFKYANSRFNFMDTLANASV